MLLKNDNCMQADILLVFISNEYLVVTSSCAIFLCCLIYMVLVPMCIKTEYAKNTCFQKVLASNVKVICTVLFNVI